jgi:hypothetical protein
VVNEWKYKAHKTTTRQAKSFGSRDSTDVRSSLKLKLHTGSRPGITSGKVGRILSTAGEVWFSRSAVMNVMTAGKKI